MFSIFFEFRFSHSSRPVPSSTFISYTHLPHNFSINLESAPVLAVRQYFITRISFRTIFHFAFSLCSAFSFLAHLSSPGIRSWCLCYSEIQIFSRSRRQNWKHETWICYCGRSRRRRCHHCRNRLARIKSILIKRINGICFCESPGGICALHPCKWARP